MQNEPDLSPGEYQAGWNAAIEHCAAIAELWRDENKAAAARALKMRGFGYSDMADALDGAAIECNAIAGEIRKLSLAAALKSRAMQEDGNV